jgi:hypothetical protein
VLDGARGDTPWHYIAGRTVVEGVDGADAGVEFVPAMPGGLTVQRLPVKPRRSYASQAKSGQGRDAREHGGNPNEPGRRNA